VAGFDLSVQHDGAVTTVRIVGELDLATTPELRQLAFGELAKATCTTLVLDVAGLTFLDSTGLGCWVELRNEALATGRSLRLDRVPDGARKTLTIGGLAPVFGLEPSASPTAGLGDESGAAASAN
jgi:anti-sigma B factor antagonist